MMRIPVTSIIALVPLLLAVTADARDRARLEDERRLPQDFRAAASDVDADRAARSLGEIASVKGLDVLIAEYAEYAVTRDVNGERRLALAYFVNSGGEWKIESM